MHIPGMSLLCCLRYQNRFCGKYFHLRVAPICKMGMQNCLKEWKRSFGSLKYACLQIKNEIVETDHV